MHESVYSEAKHNMNTTALDQTSETHAAQRRGRYGALDVESGRSACNSGSGRIREHGANCHKQSDCNLRSQVQTKNLSHPVPKQPGKAYE